MGRNTLGDENRNQSDSKKRLYKILILLIIAIGIFITAAAIEILFKIDIILFFKNLFLLKYLPKLGNNTGLGLLFIFGVLTSFHCIGMCGGIAISQSVRKAQTDTAALKSKSHAALLPSLLYNLGRVISYTIVGGIVGGLGRVISFSGPWKAVVPIVGGLFMIIMAINLLGIFPFLRKFNIRMPSFAAKKIFKGSNYSPIVVGLLSGLMPCGPLQIVQLYALGTRSIVLGAVSMFVFSVGTVSLLFTFGAINTILNKKFSKIILKASAVLVFVLGIVMIGRGLALTGISMDMPQIVNKGETVSAVINGNYQNVTIKIKPDSFPPILVQKGLPVKWIINVDKENLNECNNAITIPKFNIEKNLIVGDNIVEFTPEETGEFTYTCWMGMIKSKITVVDNLQEEKKAQNQDVQNNGSVAENNNQSGSSESKDKDDSNTKAVTAVTTATAASEHNTEAATPVHEAAPKISAAVVPEVSTKPAVTTNPSPSVTPAPTPSIAPSPVSSVVTFTGYIQDEDCFIQYAPNYGDDSKGCLSMRGCAKSGYGITVFRSDGTYEFYYFDGNFAKFSNGNSFDGTGSQLTAWNLIHDTSKQNHITVTVSGTLNGNTIVSPYDGKSYPVIKVSSLIEN